MKQWTEEEIEKVRREGVPAWRVVGPICGPILLDGEPATMSLRKAGDLMTSRSSRLTVQPAPSAQVLPEPQRRPWLMEVAIGVKKEPRSWLQGIHERKRRARR